LAHQQGHPRHRHRKGQRHQGVGEEGGGFVKYGRRKISAAERDAIFAVIAPAAEKLVRDHNLSAGTIGKMMVAAVRSASAPVPVGKDSLIDSRYVLSTKEIQSSAGGVS
tara:strand:- start:19443 stop:19769 length:327 start_codon:yes stop_codon:yes gene_type:complete